ncbi:hypothetical protein BWZ22_01250 [Seonamhaeicola sp. S2-3]|uniref:hypothetical protein n=1 Tax=Seonamhaeicola sp. S2-3 TaxID=1936081 RepID=UPI000972CA97|nr:hypothetical protein [Seonamhaeicola sp. S2-3]APY09952.1 hypothetical protein BWZ22_01250 [Seonamhaeicola sp. S2-3]
MSENFWELRNELVKEFESDAKENFLRLEKKDSELNKRNYIRSLFCLYEIIIANLRESIADRIWSKAQYGESFDLHKFYSLMDESAKINQSGKINKRPNQTPFANMVKFVLKTYCEEFNITENLFSNGWSDFKESIEIRNRVTHPKFDQEFKISEDDLRKVEKGREWWNLSIKFIKENGNNKTNF